MSDTGKKIKTDGPQLDNHVPSPGSGAPAAQDPTGGEVASETQVTEESTK
ncbi:hypothetical protein [Streptomyces radiopugnans]